MTVAPLDFTVGTPHHEMLMQMWVDNDKAPMGLGDIWSRTHLAPAEAAQALWGLIHAGLAYKNRWRYALTDAGNTLAAETEPF